MRSQDGKYDSRVISGADAVRSLLDVSRTTFKLPQLNCTHIAPNFLKALLGTIDLLG